VAVAGAEGAENGTDGGPTPSTQQVILRSGPQIFSFKKVVSLFGVLYLSHGGEAGRGTAAGGANRFDVRAPVRCEFDSIRSRVGNGSVRYGCCRSYNLKRCRAASIDLSHLLAELPRIGQWERGCAPDVKRPDDLVWETLRRDDKKATNR
jgi:hypothetical protein